MTYSVAVDVWSNGVTYSLTVATGNDVPGDVAAAYGLADPLTITHRLADGDRLIQEHPEPDEATFSLIAPDSTTYAQLTIGDPVRIQVYPAGGFTGSPVTFHGRVSSVSARPHDLGVLYTVACVDYLADLAELTVGQTDYPRELVGTRLARIMADAGVGWADHPDAPFSGFPWGAGVWFMAARSKSPTDALSLILETLNSEQTYTAGTDELGAAVAIPVSVPIGGSDGAALQKRLWFAPVITNGRLDPVTPYKLSQGPPYTKRMRYAPPARLTNVAGVWTVTVAAADSSPSTGAPIIDGGNVDVGLSFEQTKGSGLPSRITGADSTGRSITWDWAVSYVRNIGTGLVTALGAPPGNQQVITQQVTTAADDPITSSGSGITAYWRVPFPPDLRATWSTSSLTWHAWHVPSWRRPELTELLTISRANATKAPPNREWLVGQVSGTVLTVAQGRPTIEITLVPAQLDFQIQAWAQGASLGVCRFDSPILGTITLAQLSTRDTFSDYQIVRGS